MSEARPDPLVLAEVDLQDFKFMPLDVQRLRDSDLASDETPEACWAAVLLWSASWHQVPAASIPDNDEWMAKHAGYKARGKIDKAWFDIKPGALRGWVLCSDGRWYHPVVAEKARDAWRSKLFQRFKTEYARIKKHNQRHDMSLQLPDFDAWIAVGCPQGHALPVPGDNHHMSQGQIPLVPRDTRGVSPESPSDFHSKGQGEGQRQGQGQLLRDSVPPPGAGRVDPPTPPPDPTPEPQPQGQQASPYGAMARRLMQTGMSRVSPGNQPFRALVDAGVTFEEFEAYIPQAMSASDPFSYLVTTVANERKRMAQRAAEMPQGPMPPARQEKPMTVPPQETTEQYVARVQRERDADVEQRLSDQLKPETKSRAAEVRQAILAKKTVATS